MRVPRETAAVLTADGDLVPPVGPEADAPRLWPFTQARRFPWRSRNPRWLDPINVMVLRLSPADVGELLRGQRWVRPDDGATHRTWIDGGFVRMFDHLALGSRAERVHVRLFPFADHTLIGAHHEVADDRGHHQVTSWDRARDTTLEALTGGGAVTLAPTAAVCPPNLRGVSGDGRVWRAVVS